MIDTMNVIRLGLGEYGSSRDQDTVYVAFGLGSCIGVALYDSSAKVGAMAHVVLSNSQTAVLRGGEFSPGRFADTSIPRLLSDMVAKGARREKIIAKIAGGADMFGLNNGKQGILRIGEQNVDAVKESLKKHNVPLVAMDVLGRQGRTMQLFITDGRVTVRTIGGQERAL